MLAWLEFVFLGASWGAAFLFGRIAAPELGPVGLAAFRVYVAALVLLPFWWPYRRELPKQWRRVLLMGLFNAVLPFVLFGWAVIYLPAGHASIINSLTALTIITIGSLFFGERQPMIAWIGLLVGLAGIVLAAEPWESGMDLRWLPSLAALGGTICYAFPPFWAKKTRGLPPIAIAGVTMAAAGLLFLPLWPFFIPQQEISLQAWGAATAQGVLPTGIAFASYYRLWKRWGPVKSGMVVYLIPFFGIFWGWLVLGEKVEEGWAWGLALVLAGVWMGRKSH